MSKFEGVVKRRGFAIEIKYYLELIMRQFWILSSNIILIKLKGSKRAGKNCKGNTNKCLALQFDD